MEDELMSQIEDMLQEMLTENNNVINLNDIL